MVVDDDETTRALVVRILRRIGFQKTLEGADGQEALEMVHGFVPAFVVCDLHMKPMDGLSFVAAMRFGENNTLKGLPVIMLTSEMRPDAREVAEKLNITDYIVKPATMIELKAAAAKALGLELP